MLFFASREWSEIGLFVSYSHYLPHVGALTDPPVVLYAVKNFLQVTVYALEVVLPHEARTQARRREKSLSFRSFGDVRNSPAASGFSRLRSYPQPFTVPKDAYDITLLTRTIGICTEKGVVVADPTKWVDLSVRKDRLT